MELFKGIRIEDTEGLPAGSASPTRRSGRRQELQRRNFKSLERLWEAVAPDPPWDRYSYNWLCDCGRGAAPALSSVHLWRARRQETRQLIEENTSFIETAQALPVYKIDKDYVTEKRSFQEPADKAAALEAVPLRGTGRGRAGLYVPAAW